MSNVSRLSDLTAFIPVPRCFSTLTHFPLFISPLKHSILPLDAEVCIFVKDPQKLHKELFESKGVKRINKVYDMMSHTRTVPLCIYDRTIILCSLNLNLEKYFCRSLASPSFATNIGLSKPSEICATRIIYFSLTIGYYHCYRNC